MRKILILILILSLISISVLAAKSTNYQSEIGVVTGGGTSASINYNASYIVVGGGGNSSSDNYTSDYQVQITYNGVGIVAEEQTNESNEENNNQNVPSGGNTGGSTGGGIIAGGSTTEAINFTTKPTKVDEKLDPRTKKIVNLIISNIGKSTSFSVQLEGDIKKYAFLNKNNFELSKNQSEILEILLKVPDKYGQIYRGNIIIGTSELTKKIPINLITPSKKEELLDVRLEILEYYLEQGNDVRAKIELFNLGATTRVDIQLTYQIEKNGEIISSSEETIALETSVSIIRSLKLPENQDYGKYSFKIIAKYGNQTAIAKQDFKLVEDASRGTGNFFLIYWPILLLCILGLVLIVLVLPLIYKFFKEFRLIKRNRGYSKKYGFVFKKTNIASKVFDEFSKEVSKNGILSTIKDAYKNFYTLRLYIKLNRKLRKIRKILEARK